MISFERALVGELEGSHGDRPAVIDGHGHCGGYTTLGGSTVFSDDDLTDALAKATRWSANDAARDTGFVVTQGPRGATLCHHGTATHIPTQPVADELAPVGAGDVFGATVGLEFHAAYVAEGMDRFGALLRAVARATEAASTYVGAGGTPTVPEPVIVRGRR